MDEVVSLEMGPFDVGALEGSSRPSACVRLSAWPGAHCVGPYVLGPRVASSPVKSISQHVARKQFSDTLYTVKVLTMCSDRRAETNDDRQGKILLHNEFSLLSILQNQDGVVHQHAFFKDRALEESADDGSPAAAGRTVDRICLVLDCIHPHGCDGRTTCNLMDMQHFVIRCKRLSEHEAAVIFYDIVRVVADLHEKNIVHRDLKLGNIMLDRCTRRITLTNFCLGKQLIRHDDMLSDQKGSPAYISPDVLSGKPYLAKPSDMWALGVVLYSMLYGTFPFYEPTPSRLFAKIKNADYAIPRDGRVSFAMVALIRGLLSLDVDKRLTAPQVLRSLLCLIFEPSGRQPKSRVQHHHDDDDDDEEEDSSDHCNYHHALHCDLDVMDAQIVPEATSNQRSSSSSDRSSGARGARLPSFRVGADTRHALLDRPPASRDRPARRLLIPVQHVGQDARDLTWREKRIYRRFLSGRSSDRAT